MGSSLRLFGFAIVVAAVIGAIGWFTLQPRPQAATGANAVAPGGCYTAEVNNRHYSFSTWFLVANQRDNRVDWDPKGMTCNHEAGTADIRVQITHRTTQRDTNQIDTGATIITQDTGFTRERIQYRFNCKTREIAALERDIMGDGEVVLRNEILLADGQPQFKPYGEGGIGVSLDGPVCGAGMGLR